MIVIYQIPILSKDFNFIIFCSNILILVQIITLMKSFEN